MDRQREMDQPQALYEKAGSQKTKPIDLLKDLVKKIPEEFPG
jgi:hypothetical protein